MHTLHALVGIFCVQPQNQRGLLRKELLMKYVIYCRKSSESEDRQVLSIPAQISELQELAQKNGLKIVEVLTESQSAKAPGRPIFNHMMNQVSEGKVDGILCWKLDRLARNPVDGGQIQWMLQNGLLGHIMTSERDYKTGDNVLMMSVELGMANQFILDLSKSVKRGNRERAKNGYPNYMPPLGYTNDTINKTIVKDPERFDLVRKIWDLTLTGAYSVAQICRMANNDWGFITPQRRRSGGKKLSQSAVYRLLENPFYYGVFTVNGEEYLGNYPAMITKEGFDKVQMILGRNVQRKPKTREFAFTGMIKCGSCGCQVTAEEKTKYYHGTNRLADYIYYRCTKRKSNIKCDEKPVTLDDLEDQIDDILSTLKISDKFKDWALKYMGELNDKEIEERTSIYKNLQNTYTKKQKELDSLTKMRYRELIDDDEYLSQKKELVGEINNFKTKMNGTEDRAKGWLELTEKAFVFAYYAGYWFEHGSKQQKREIAQAIGLNFILEGKKLTFQIQKPFQIIMKRPNNFNWRARWDSNPRPIA